MSTDPFSPPASSSGIDWKDALGHLLLVSPLEVAVAVPTSLGEKDAIRADIVDLDTGDTFTDVLVFPRVLQGQLRSKIGGKVLGRLAQGVAKAGQSAPWKLDEFTDADAQKARAYLANQFTPPAPAAAAAPATAAAGAAPPF